MSRLENYRIVRLTHLNGDENYTIQKTRPHWLTRKPEVVYLENCYDHWGWTRNPDRAETWLNAIEADRTLDRIKKVAGRKVIKVEIV